MRGNRRGVPGGRSLLAGLSVVVAVVGGCGETLEAPTALEHTRPARLLAAGTPQVARLVSDVWPGDGSSFPRFLANANGTLYFEASDALTGGELWVSDGSSEGTVRVADLSSNHYPGTSSFTAVGDTVFFVLDDGWTGTELWKTNGTALGTMLVKNINLGSGENPGAPAYPSWLTPMNGVLYFTADSGDERSRLWRSDGTEDGTVRVVSSAGSALGESRWLVNLHGTLVFAGSTPDQGSELWRSDGTEAGTVLIRDSNPGPGDFLTPWGGMSPTVSNGVVFFMGNDGMSGPELWKSDGTEAGTVRVRDIAPGEGGSEPSEARDVNGTLFFMANDGMSGPELWKSDGTEAGTVLVRDIAPGPGGSSPSTFAVLGDTLFFLADDGVSGRELWKSDGTEVGTVRVRDLRPGAASSSMQELVVVGSTLYFGADDGVSGRELWKSDGTEAGTVRVRDIWPGAWSSSPSWLTERDGILYFVADEGLYGMELWRSDGTEAGTVLLRNMELRPRSSNAMPMADLNGTLLFSSSTELGTELWRSDGTAAGTRLVWDLFPGMESGLPSTLTWMDGQLYFLASDGLRRMSLWRSDGIESAPVRIKEINPGPSMAFSSTSPITRVGRTLYFVATDGTSGRELWKSDGTEAGTVLVKDIWPGSLGGLEGYGEPLARVGDVIYFAARDGSGAQELWKSDGTEAGTVRVKDIRPGVGGSYPRSFMTVGGTLYFLAEDSAGQELWKSDGTEAGTVRVKDIRPGILSSSIRNLTVVGETLYFTANDGTLGEEVWKSDGTEEGTVVVRDITRGSSGSFLAALTAFQGRLFFAAMDASHGGELWSSDGTEAGTFMVKDIRAGPQGSQPRSMTDIAGTLVFAAYGSDGNASVWQSDGTEEGTRLLAEIPGTTASQPSGFLLAGSHLYFRGHDSAHGGELWRVADVIDLTPPTVTCPMAVEASATSASGAVVEYPAAVASDNDTASPALTYSHASGATFPLGVTSVVVTARDEAGNSGTCSFTVTVSDTTAPELACPADVTAVATSNAGATVEYPEATASDTVSAVTVGYSQASGTTFPVGVTVVTVTATDGAGNDASCTFSVRVSDTEAPAITCPADVTAEAMSASGANVTYPPATATGTGTVAVTYSHASGSVFALGGTQVTATARDERGRTATCAFAVAVRDTTPPEPGCPIGPIEAEARSGAGADVPLLFRLPRDAVSRASIVSISPSGDAFPLGTTEVTVTARDEAGNVGTCTFAVTVRDTTAPVLSCPADVTVQATQATGIEVDYARATTSDAVSSPTLVYSQDAGTRFAVGATPVTVTATDAAGNTSTCGFQVTVLPPAREPISVEPEQHLGCSTGAGTPAGWGALLLLAWAGSRRRLTRTKR
ncbi:HYR domain-containing protein [Pyxidicoccus fallax]|uniref:HYR domain-containing protein n=1 Tax=Pyxidicoccus fallax TaxID=394095 RepID=A0A848LQ18_9BACT|nr:ELWxxDGT repeat protein [Pyxidicoccus fallax]NMO19769.1 HYR domain-containing protein [Pyxidicoccus fallax]NPC80703.1 HYR domain-containing protein [Pyxidicoccus fallax]